MTRITSPNTGASSASIRRAGPAQGVLLLSMSCLSVLGAVLLAPMQPRMVDAFADQPGVAALVPLVITVPALMIGLLAPVAGRIVDRVGRLQLLTAALVVYAAFGTAPLWLNSLPLIVASRFGVGAAEAAIMTCCTTLLADYFEGKERDRYLGLQMVCTSLSAVVFIAVGGALGQVDWRAPFWLYSVSLVFAVLCPLLLWRPVAAAADASRDVPMRWRPLLIPLAVTFVGGILFYAPIVELSYLLDAIGVSSPGIIGLVSGFASAATALGALLFSRISTWGPRRLLAASFLLIGAGLAGMGVGNTATSIAAGAIDASAGAGVLLPTLVTWVLSQLDFEQRGRGTGAWTASLFTGEFICPILVIGLAALFGGLPPAIIVLGAASAATALVVRTALR